MERYKVCMSYNGSEPMQLSDPSTEDKQEAELVLAKHNAIADHIYSAVERAKIKFTIETLPF